MQALLNLVVGKLASFVGGLLVNYFKDIYEAQKEYNKIKSQAEDIAKNDDAVERARDLDRLSEL